jgi:hypothetical protein
VPRRATHDCGSNLLVKRFFNSIGHLKCI